MTKISQLPPANSLSGYEKIALVQDGHTVQSRLFPLSDLPEGNSVRIGYQAEGAGGSTIAIGAYSAAFGGYSTIVVGRNVHATYDAVVLGTATSGMSGVVIGGYSYSSALNAIAVGMYAAATGVYGIALGCYVKADSRALAMGFGADTRHSESSIAIGTESATYSIGQQYGSTDAVAIGYRTYIYGHKGIALGYKAQSKTLCVSIGSMAGNYPITGGRNVDIGAYSYSMLNYCTSVGGYASNLTGDFGTAIGALTWTNSSGHGSALGNPSGAFGLFATAIGGARASGTASTSVGRGGAYYAASMVLGSGSNLRDHTAGSLVIGGLNTSPLPPTQHFQKFVGQTTAPVNCTVTFTVGSSDITVTAPGYLNAASFNITVNPSPTDHASVSVGSDVTVYLASDAEGFPIDAANHLSDIAAAFPFFITFQFTGPDIALNVGYATHFGGGSDGSTCALTVDGGPAANHNTLVLFSQGAVARITGRVVAANPSLFSSDGDVASFLLAPVTVYRQNDGVYTFLSEPTFTMENSTEGASAWPMPTLVADGGNLMYITVNNRDAAVLNWMAHVTIETNN